MNHWPRTSRYLLTKDKAGTALWALQCFSAAWMDSKVAVDKRQNRYSIVRLTVFQGDVHWQWSRDCQHKTSGHTLGPWQRSSLRTCTTWTSSCQLWSGTFAKCSMTRCGGCRRLHKLCLNLSTTACSDMQALISHAFCQCCDHIALLIAALDLLADLETQFQTACACRGSHYESYQHRPFLFLLFVMTITSNSNDLGNQRPNWSKTVACSCTYLPGPAEPA